MLGDPAKLAGGNFGAAQCVQQSRLAVVDMAHDRHDWRTCHWANWLLPGLGSDYGNFRGNRSSFRDGLCALRLPGGRDNGNNNFIAFAQSCRDFRAELLIQRCQHAQSHQLLLNVWGGDTDQCRKVLQGDNIGDINCARRLDRSRRRRIGRRRGIGRRRDTARSRHTISWGRPIRCRSGSRRNSVNCRRSISKRRRSFRHGGSCAGSHTGTQCPCYVFGNRAGCRFRGLAHFLQHSQQIIAGNVQFFC